MGTIKMIDTFDTEGNLESMDSFKFIAESPPIVSEQPVSGSEDTPSGASSRYIHQVFADSPSTLSYNPRNLNSDQTASSCPGCFEFSPNNSSEAPDFSDAAIKYLNDILMEEDLYSISATIHDYQALQTTEKLLYDAIGEVYTPTLDQFPSLPDHHDQINAGVSIDEVNGSTVNSIREQSQPECSGQDGNASGLLLESSSIPSGSMDGSEIPDAGQKMPNHNLQWIEKTVANFIKMGNPDFKELTYSNSDICTNEVPVRPEKSSRSAVKKKRGLRKHPRDGSGIGDTRTNKHLEGYSDLEAMGQFDDILLECRTGEDDSSHCNQPRSFPSNDAGGGSVGSEKSKGPSKSRSSRGKKQTTIVEDVVDLNALLSQCAQAVATSDLRNARDLFKRIRQHSSPLGNGTQRVSHYFADALEARMTGTASQQYSDIVDLQISAPRFLKAYKSYVKAVPFRRMSFFLANKSIANTCVNAKSIHIIDFGVLFGIQWPCFIQHLSHRKNGPLKLRITAVDFPQKGYQPAARVEETVRRLSAYCKRFDVPFESQIIAERWETLQPKDFNIKKDELLVANCLYRSRTLLDDTIGVDSPRDAFLNLVRKLKPDLFVHGIVNGTHNIPFFTTRFREAMYHYSSVFDDFDATMPREDEEYRQLIERDLYGKDILNVVASEGAERVERPETYKQWQARNRRAGFKQVPFDRALVSTTTAMVKAHYHKDFVVDENSNWILQGWKGRLLLALSCWKPA